MTKFVAVDEPMTKYGLPPILFGLIESWAHGEVVATPTKPEFCWTTNCVAPTVSPPVEIVDVAVVDVALKFPNVGVDVAVTTPDEFVERREFTATPPSVNAPVFEIEDVAVPPK